MHVRLGPEADADEADEGDEVDQKRCPVCHPESDPQGTAEHDVDTARSQHSSNQHHDLKFCQLVGFIQ